MRGPGFARSDTAPIAIADNRPTSSRDKPEQIAEAAKQFESLLIAGILKSVREAAQSADSETDQAGTSALEMAEEQMASMLAQNGGLGLARLLVAGLGSRDEGQKASGSSTGNEKPGVVGSGLPPHPAPG